MANYKEQSIPGTMTQFTRCNTITIQNPHEGGNSAKNIRFDEEIVKTLPDGEVLKSPPVNGGITKEFDPSAIIELRDPETWELTGGTITMGEVYAIIASAYWQSALERDAELSPKLNVNTATLEELDALSGVGPTTAQAIIDGRPWADVDDLTSINGISQTMVDGWGVTV